MAELSAPEISLANQIRAGNLEPADALSIGAQVGNELAAAHAVGRVHGNLTSSSVLLRSESGRIHARVVDFAAESPTSVSLDHLAPERRGGGPPSVAGDIYSFGRLLSEIQHSLRLPEVLSPGWDLAIWRCTAAAPQDRYNSIAAAMHDLHLPLIEETTPIARPQSTAQPSRQWGQFQLLQRLGQGSFGEVYRAWDPVLEREVALKLLLPRGLNPEQEFAEIIAEARAIAKVRHPNIVPVYGVDRHDGRVGFWSDFVRGRTLSRLLQTDGPMKPAEAAQAVAVLCDALSAVHHAGLLHRDIKASNAMRDDDGRILLMDFGLSQELHQAKGYAGTPNYMAPELLADQPPSVQSDVYALGVLLLYLCTGEYPLSAQDSTASRPRTLPSLGLPEEIERVVSKATSRDPQNRYVSTAKMAEALRSSVAEMTAAPLPAVALPAPRRPRRLWIAAAAVLLVAGAGLAIYPALREHSQARKAGASTAAYQLYQQAEEDLARYDKPGNTQKAIALFQQTLQRSPDFALAQAGLALADWRMYLDTSDQTWATQASTAATAAAEINPNLAPVQIALGTIHVAQGQFALGMQELQQAASLDPVSAEAHAALAEAYHQQNRVDDAKKEFETAIDLAPDYWRWPYLLGALEIDTGDLKSAEVSLKAAQDKSPDNSRVLYNLGLVYRKEGRMEEAAKALQQSLSYDPNENTMMALAYVLLMQGKSSDAIDLYQRAVRANSNDWDAWGNLASAQQWASANSAQAEADYRRAAQLAHQQLATTPDDPFLLSNLAGFYAHLHQPQQALPLVRKSLALAPHNPDVLETDAETYELVGNRDQALNLLGKALQLGFSAEYVRKVPELKALCKDPRAPKQIRD